MRMPFREPLRNTLLRTGAIALAVGVLVAQLWGRPGRWPMVALLVLWPSFGGHWVEVFFLNWLRPRLPASRGAQVAGRLAVWFVGGVCLGTGMRMTAATLTKLPTTNWPAWWLAGLVFIGVELVAHLGLQLSGRPSFYNGRE